MNHSIDENQSQIKIDIIDFLFTILKQWKILVCVVVIFAAIFYIYTELAVDKLYTSDVTVWTYSGEVTDSGLSSSQLTVAKTLVANYNQVLHSYDFLTDVAELTELNYTPKKISSMLNVSLISDTTVMKISVTSTDPAHSEKLAQTIAELSIIRLPSYYEQGKFFMIDSAKLPETPSSPNVFLNTFIGGFLGGVIFVAIVFIYCMFNDKISDGAELASRFGIPFLGSIPDQDTIKVSSSDEKERSHK